MQCRSVAVAEFNIRPLFRKGKAGKVRKMEIILSSSQKAISQIGHGSFLIEFLDHPGRVTLISEELLSSCLPP